ncbi:helix-turn-helix domain-containing protein [Marinitoga sp. 1155]|uniref:helix-turn-helix domain-containing protein n=1 Tax=Marinitoga sp. 1155 TaxID=1428448 RepID=UPI00065A5508|nr:helix-turn-helix domain-containing protein [Marinitoga sp. 1155]AJW77002.1 hypothetical protein UF09_36 [Marinitoga camini virus 2]KLO24822.1 hypothetical protein X274_02445 [Marinitoga sp. 1155]
MRMTYEKSTDSAYIYFSKEKNNKIVKTISLNDDMTFNADIDENGNVIGIEILDFKETYGYIPKNIQVESLNDADSLKVYTPAEVAKILKVNSDTVRRYIRTGKIRASRVGKTYRITQKNIEEFLNSTLVK